MEAAGIILRGLALVVEKEEGPRMVFRYDPAPAGSGGSLFTALVPRDFAKLFCAKRALRGALVELQLDDVLFVSCPTAGGEREGDERGDGGDDGSVPTFWGDAEGEAAGSDGASRPVAPSRLKFFDVIWAATGARDGERGARLERLEAIARDVSAALHHEERRCGYVSAECAKMLAAGADVHDDDAARTAAQTAASSPASESITGKDGRPGIYLQSPLPRSNRIRFP